MINIKFIRENPDGVRENILKKGQSDKIPLINEVLNLDTKYKELLQESQSLRHQRNTLTDEIRKIKESGGDVSEVMEKAKQIPVRIKDIEAELMAIKEKLDEHLFAIPNMMHESVPAGKSDKENVELEKFGEIKEFDFRPKPHQEIATNLGGADFESSGETSGNGFYYLQGDVALLNQALIQFAIKKMVEKGFLYVETPLLLNDRVINNVVDLHDREHMIYKIEGEELYLIGTSEHSLIGRYINKTIPETELPLKHTSYSMCFRKEKGSHGLDERGLFRTHQFNKVEMIVICSPDESMHYYEQMKQITIDIFKELELPTRVVQICSGDLGDLKHTQVDIEAWSPRRNDYFEVGSCSNLTDAQSQLLKIRAKGPEGNYHPHTLNNTAIATSRALVAILENNQQKDGSVLVPRVLIPYIGKDVLDGNGRS